jgi:murein DD-endopeptidase MepM/ murein hydrolase activator NlpD
VGAIAIVVVVYGSMDPGEHQEGLLPALKRVREGQLPAVIIQSPRTTEGLRWSAPRTDKLQMLSGATSTRFIIHETLTQRRSGRDFIQPKPYARIVARLTPVPLDKAAAVPPFNPLKLFAATETTTGEEGSGETRAQVDVSVVELLGGILPTEDGQELDGREVAEIVSRAREAENEPAVMRPGFRAEGSELLPQSDRDKRRLAEAQLPNTTVLQKSTSEGDDEEDGDEGEVRVVRAARGETLLGVLMRTGADKSQALQMVHAGKGIFADSAVTPSHEVHVTMVPSLTQQGAMEPARFSVFADGHDHKVTVTRNSAGEFVASATPVATAVARAALGDGDTPQSSSLYASLYHTALMQNLSDETILQILRIHAYETDFRRRLRGGDAIELFFDLKDDNAGAAEAPPGELLYSAISTGGDTSRYYRFRTPDGLVDFYDEFGNNSRKFLMRRPVRGENVRLSSGFGMRRHPLLGFVRPHNGIDWSAPIGTPIMAAGNGVIEEAKFRGEYGNYIRIRHANGYQTTYGHMSRFAPGIRDGLKVKQGQVIGHVGSTGLSSGPHLHYEILVQSRFVDPLSIQVPQERRLTGRHLTDFQKERARIDDLMRRAPVLTASR